MNPLTVEELIEIFQTLDPKGIVLIYALPDKGCEPNEDGLAPIKQVNLYGENTYILAADEGKY